MKTKLLLARIGISLLPLMLAGSAAAQWNSQTLLLRPGWNAIYLEIQPEPRECDALFASLPVESVWRFNRKQATVQFIEDPTQLVPNAPDWLTWLPASNSLASQARLFTLEGGRPYLVKVADNANPFTWTIQGTPVNRKPDWLADSLNFVGFPLPTNNPPALQAFFTNATALATNRIYRLNTNGVWLVVNNPATNRMLRGESFWIRSTGLPDYGGPLEVQTDRRVGLDFGRILTEQTLRIRNTSTNLPRIAIVRPIASASAPSSAFPAVAGAVPLGYWQNDFSAGAVGWTNLPAQLTSNLPPGKTWELRLEVRRREMSPYSPPPGITEALYQSLLEVTDSSNTTRVLIPVKANGLQEVGRGRGAGLIAAGVPAPPPHARAGLWMGNVTITHVSQPSSANPLIPLPVSGDFQFRILVHVDAVGQARLLQKVLQMWRMGTTNESGEVAVPGRFVLLTDESLVSQQFTGAALRDGKAVARRFSSAAFGFRDPLLMSGSGDFGADGSQFSCTVRLPYDHPLNPFVHRYHPDHNNLDDRSPPQVLTVRTNATGQIYTAESTGVDRAVILQFAAADPENLALPGWGDSQLGGIYTETLYGLHKTPLQAQGTFRLQRASRVAVLNDLN